MPASIVTGCPVAVADGISDDVVKAALQQRRSRREPSALRTSGLITIISDGASTPCTAEEMMAPSSVGWMSIGDRAGLQPAGVEQVADETVEPIGLLLDRCVCLRELLRLPHDIVRRAGRRSWP